MRVLSDREILRWVKGYNQKPSILEGLRVPTPPFGKNSPIQPCSVDLSIGGIFLPDVGALDEGSVGKPKEAHELKPGETAVVVTREKIRFPSVLGGICFPPASTSTKGLLMTNPGHIDPGFSGVLTFTLINMSKENYLLQRNDPIVSCLIFALDPAPEKDYASLGHEPVLTAPSRDLLRRLSKSFLNIGLLPVSWTSS